MTAAAVATGAVTVALLVLASVAGLVAAAAAVLVLRALVAAAVVAVAVPPRRPRAAVATRATAVRRAVIVPVASPPLVAVAASAHRNARRECCGVERPTLTPDLRDGSHLTSRQLRTHDVLTHTARTSTWRPRRRRSWRCVPVSVARVVRMVHTHVFCVGLGVWGACGDSL